MYHFVNDKQLQVINLKRSGLTFREIAEKLDLSPQRTQQLYRKGLENLRIENDIRRYHKEFIKAADNVNWQPNMLIRFYKMLKRYGIEYGWTMLDEEELRSYDGIGKKYVEFLRYAKKFAPL